MTYESLQEIHGKLYDILLEQIFKSSSFNIFLKKVVLD